MGHAAIALNRLIVLVNSNWHATFRISTPDLGGISLDLCICSKIVHSFQDILLSTALEKLLNLSIKDIYGQIAFVERVSILQNTVA